jgi:hypothetical protein
MPIMTLLDAAALHFSLGPLLTLTVTGLIGHVELHLYALLQAEEVGQAFPPANWR